MYDIIYVQCMCVFKSVCIFFLVFYMCVFLHVLFMFKSQQRAVDDLHVCQPRVHTNHTMLEMCAGIYSVNIYAYSCLIECMYVFSHIPAAIALCSLQEGTTQVYMYMYKYVYL